jgi:hypothetical protein
MLSNCSVVGRFVRTTLPQAMDQSIKIRSTTTRECWLIAARLIGSQAGWMNFWRKFQLKRAVNFVEIDCHIRV